MWKQYHSSKIIKRNTSVFSFRDIPYILRAQQVSAKISNLLPCPALCGSAKWFSTSLFIDSSNLRQTVFGLMEKQYSMKPWSYRHVHSVPTHSTHASLLTGQYGIITNRYLPLNKFEPHIFTQLRHKMVKSSSYRRRPRAGPTGQSQKAHIGIKRLSAEYVTPGAILVKQRRFLAWNFELKRRKRHQKMYPGENVGVSKASSLVALCHGRVKYTHDVRRKVMLANVLPEKKEELLREDLWRYRTEHVFSGEENRHICSLRSKASLLFPKVLVNPPTKPLPRPKKLSRFDQWENPTLPDVPYLHDER